jgi:hypothetical protein
MTKKIYYVVGNGNDQALTYEMIQTAGTKNTNPTPATL